MSIRIMSAVFESKTLGPTERLVMLALADHADDSGRCYPSNSRLCERTGLSERAVRQNVRALEAGGFLTVHIGIGQAGANVYIVRPEGGQEMPPAGNAPGRKCTPPRHMVPVKGAPDAPKPSGTIIEPSEDIAAPKSRRRPEVPLPANWTPNDKNISDAQARQFSAKEIEDEADRFRNHHLARDTRFRDWDAAWRTWLANSRKFARGGMAGQAATGGRGPGRSLASIVAERRLGNSHG